MLSDHTRSFGAKECERDTDRWKARSLYWAEKKVLLGYRLKTETILQSTNTGWNLGYFLYFVFMCTFSGI